MMDGPGAIGLDAVAALVVHGIAVGCATLVLPNPDSIGVPSSINFVAVRFHDLNLPSLHFDAFDAGIVPTASSNVMASGTAAACRQTAQADARPWRASEIESFCHGQTSSR